MKSYPRLYGITLFMITLTGFAQMPIFKRYYIADIPGLGWLDRFYVTHSIHYAMAGLLMALAAHAVTRLFLSGRGLSALTGTGLAKGALVAGLILTGILMVVRNLPGVFFPHGAIIAMNLAHTGFCMALLGLTLAGAVTGKTGWTRRDAS